MVVVQDRVAVCVYDGSVGNPENDEQAGVGLGKPYRSGFNGPYGGRLDISVPDAALLHGIREVTG